jgi:protein-L-isoaspartate O-methyltransferase
MIIPVGPEGQTQRLTLITKTDGTVERRELAPVRFVPFLRDDP